MSIVKTVEAAVDTSNTWQVAFTNNTLSEAQELFLVTGADGVAPGVLNSILSAIKSYVNGNANLSGLAIYSYSETQTDITSSL